MLEHVCVKFHFLMCVYDWRVCFCRRHWKWLSPYVICTNYRCLVRFKSISMHNNLVKNTEWTQLETNPQSGSKSWYIMYALVIFVCLVYIYFFLPTGTLNPHTYWGIHRTVCVSGHLMLILSCPDSHCILWIADLSKQ